MKSGQNKRPNTKLALEEVEALQATLFSAAHQALRDAMADGTVNAALLSSIGKLCSDAGVKPSTQDESNPLWSLSEQLQAVDFSDLSR